MRNVKPVTRGFFIGSAVIVVLAGFGIYSLMSQAPTHVLRISHKDPELEAAIKHAREGLPGFKKELAAPKPGEGFAVKGTFDTVGGHEYLWVKKPTFKDGVFTGILDQQPIAFAKVKGDEVKVKEKDVVDWLIKDDEGVRGMETEKILSARQGH